MWQGFSFLAVIPARGGSKGIPQKNIREFLGRPLLGWAVDVARESGVFERVIVSTDDAEIARTAEACGAEVPFLRPRELAQDATPTAAAVRHLVDRLQRERHWSPEFVTVLEPTSPGRRAFHLREAADLICLGGADSVASVSAVPHHYNPVKVLRLSDDGTVAGLDGTPVKDMIHRRQDLPIYYAFNGLVFSCRLDVLLVDPPTLWGKRVDAYVVDPRYSVDIDEPDDWNVAEERVRRILEDERSR